MTYRGKLVANNTLVASTTIPTVITTGGASSWNELTGKPFETISQDDFKVENGELKLKEESGSVEIDNKSLIKVNGVIQEAVPIYSEYIEATEEYGPGLYSDSGFEYPAGNDFDYYFDASNFVLYEDSHIYKVALKLTDGTILDGFWNPSPNGHSYGGDYSWDVGQDVYQLYIDDEGDNRWKLHIWANYSSIIHNGNVAGICLYQVDDVPAGYPSIEEICMENFLRYESLDNSATVYHKLPSEYIDFPFPEAPKDNWGEYILVAHCQGDNISYEWTPYYN